MDNCRAVSCTLANMVEGIGSEKDKQCIHGSVYACIVLEIEIATSDSLSSRGGIGHSRDSLLVAVLQTSKLTKSAPMLLYCERACPKMYHVHFRSKPQR